MEFKLTTIKHKYIVNLCSVLALLPVHAINDGWQYIKSKEISTDDTKITKFIKYFEKFWMKPDFINVWSVFSEPHRTTNIVEGWIFKINGLIKKNNILHVIKEDMTLAN